MGRCLLSLVLLACLQRSTAFRDSTLEGQHANSLKSLLNYSYGAIGTIFNPNERSKSSTLAAQHKVASNGGTIPGNHSDDHRCDEISELMNGMMDAERWLELFLMISGGIIVLLSTAGTCFCCGVSIKPRPPRYWSNGTLNPFTDSFADEVDVTKELLDPIQRLFNSTTMKSAMGLGRDGAWATHKGFKVLKVTRLENGPHWTNYARLQRSLPSVDETLKNMTKEWKTYTKSALEALDQADTQRFSDPQVKKFVESLSLDASRNERLMFHGSPGIGSRAANGCVLFETEDFSPMYAIKTAGFDDRLGSTKGMYGSGTYFADMASKADQYAGMYNEPGTGSVGEVATMFLSRVTLGCPYKTNQSLEQLRRPPCIEGHFDLNLFWNEDVAYGRPWREKGVPFRICNHQRFDSVMGDFMIDGQKKLYREYVVYEKQAYPEFCVTYQRTA